MSINSNSLSVFSYIGRDVRIVTIDGEPWWVAVDVAEALGISNSRNMVARLDDDQKGVRLMDTPGGAQRLSIISESGLYSAIFRSEARNAREFRRWVTGVVLPELHRTGSFSVVSARALPKSFSEALRDLASEIDAHEVTRAELTEVAPRADAWDALASAEGDYSVADAAKILARAGLNTGPTRLFDQLARLGWTFRGADGAWRSYADRVSRGHLAEKPQFHYHPGTGARVIDAPQVRVTVKGIDVLRRALPGAVLKAVSA